MQGLLAALGQGQGQHWHALFQQLQGLLGRGLATDGSLGLFALVHAQGFIGEAIAHVLGLFHDLARGLQPGRLQGMQLGAADYIVKSETMPGEVIAKIKKALG